MKVNLDPAKTILRQYLKELDSVKKLCDGIKGPMHARAFSIKDRMPVFDPNQTPPDSSVQDMEEEAYIWLYFEPWHPRSLMHRPKTNPLPEYYHQPAIHIYHEWFELNRDVIDRGEIIPSPIEDCSLIDYLRQLETKITDECEDRAVWILSLKSFLQYLREDIPDKTMLGGLETIFPYKMDIREDYVFKKTLKGIVKVRRQVILRNVNQAVYPIDIQHAAQIMKNLFNTVLEGRSNSQRSAAEALGFALVCHAAASARVMTEENILFKLKISNLVAPIPGAEKQWFKPEYFLQVPTINGIVNVPISKTLHDYLLALPRPPSKKQIFSLSWRAVYRTFLNKGISPSYNGNRKVENLSFLTLMSQPHHALNYRYTPPK